MTFPHPSLGLRVVASGATDLVLIRTFAAPAALVFAALTQPKLLRPLARCPRLGAHGL